MGGRRREALFFLIMEVGGVLFHMQGRREAREKTIRQAGYIHYLINHGFIIYLDELGCFSFQSPTSPAYLEFESTIHRRRVLFITTHCYSI